MKLILSKASVKQMTKTALVLGLRKLIFVCTIFRMERHTTAYTGPSRDMVQFFVLTYTLGLSMSMAQICFM